MPAASMPGKQRLLVGRGDVEDDTRSAPVRAHRRVVGLKRQLGSNTESDDAGDILRATATTVLLPAARSKSCITAQDS